MDVLFGIGAPGQSWWIRQDEELEEGGRDGADQRRRQKEKLEAWGVNDQ